MSRISGRTYLYYIQSDELITLPAQAKWMPFDETVEQVLSEDFQRLMDTGFLSDLSLDIVDNPYANGVRGKWAVFRMTERPRSR